MHHLHLQVLLNIIKNIEPDTTLSARLVIALQCQLGGNKSNLGVAGSAALAAGRFLGREGGGDEGEGEEGNNGLGEHVGSMSLRGDESKC